jgi:serine/threonine protein phosphatase PrpC
VLNVVCHFLRCFSLQVAEYVSTHIVDNLRSQDDYLTNPENALRSAIFQTEAAWETLAISSSPNSQLPDTPTCPTYPAAPPALPCAGSTALTALLLGTDLYLGNVGDCRAVLCREFRSKQLTKDHKWSNKAEKARLEQMGCHVTCDGYVAGEVAVTRALGLAHLKVTKPEMKVGKTHLPGQSLFMDKDI